VIHREDRRDVRTPLQKFSHGLGTELQPRLRLGLPQDELGAEFSASLATDLITAKTFRRVPSTDPASNAFDIETRSDGVALLVFEPSPQASAPKPARSPATVDETSQAVSVSAAR